MKKIRVVIAGLIYPVTMLHYFWRAFERREDVDLIVTGPFFNNWIPWCGGVYLPQKYVKVPQIPLPSTIANQSLHSSLIESQLPWEPDLFLEIDAGWHLSNKPKASVVAHIQTDPHVLRESYDRVRKNFDIVFCMQGPYSQPGDVYLPYAHDPTLHRPIPMEKMYDACLIGLQYEQRNRLVARLRGRGLNVYYNTGDVYDEMAMLYNESKIALSWSSLLDTPTRVFEAMGMRLPLVCNHTPDLDKFFVEGTHYLGFDTVDGAEQKVQLLLDNEALREEIAENAYQEVLAHHTWDHRIQFILEEAKLV